MIVQCRGMRRTEFRKIRRAKLSQMKVELHGFKGVAGLLDITDTDGPWRINSIGGTVTLAAPGYQWLQLCPDSENWWLTVMYDTEEQIVQYYFDITGGSHTSEYGEPRFIDRYLDIVMTPDGRYEILDRNELNAAFSDGTLTSRQYADALSTAAMIISKITHNGDYWRTLCAEIMQIMK